MDSRGLLESPEVSWGLLESPGTSWEPPGASSESPGASWRSPVASWDLLKASWRLLAPPEASWEPPGASWVLLEPPEVSWVSPISFYPCSTRDQCCCSDTSLCCYRSSADRYCCSPGATREFEVTTNCSNFLPGASWGLLGASSWGFSEPPEPLLGSLLGPPGASWSRPLPGGGNKMLPLPWRLGVLTLG